MTKEDIIDLLTLARVYDARVTVGKAETAAWFLAVNRIPAAIGHQAVVEHYTAPVEPGGAVQRIAPAHVMAHYQAHNRPCDQPLPMIPGPKASAEHIAHCRAEINNLVQAAAAKFTPEAGEPREVPRWRPGMDKRELATRQAEASRLHRAGGA